jgi:hypothetical protein
MHARRLIALIAGLACAHLAQAERLYLEARTNTVRAHAYVDVDVVLDTSNKPVGAVLFDLGLSPTNVLRPAGADGVTQPLRGGFRCDVLTTNQARPRYVAVNSLRPETAAARDRIATLRFLVTGAPGGTCSLTPTNVSVIGGAAYVDAGSTACAPIAVTSSGLTLTVAASAAVIGCDDLPAAMERGRMAPVSVYAESVPGLAGFELALAWPTSQVRVVDVFPGPGINIDYRRDLRESGALQLVGACSRGLSTPAGRVELATVWIDALTTTVSTSVGIALSNLIAGAGVERFALQAGPTSATAAIVDRPWYQGDVGYIAATNVVTNSIIVVPVAALVGTNRVPSALSGRVVYNTNLVRVSAFVPIMTGDLARATWITNLVGSGTSGFVCSQFDLGPGVAGGLTNLLQIQWQVVGPLFETGHVSVVLRGAADGVGYGIGIATGAVSESQYLLVRGAPVDADGDGMHDWYEQYFGVSDPGGDADGDQQLNVQEFCELTRPNDAGSYFGPDAVTRSNGGCWLVWPSVADRHYRISIATNLVGGPHELVVDNIAADPPVNRYWQALSNGDFQAWIYRIDGRP